MNDILEAKALLESATPENPVKFRISDGVGQHLDILVTDATVDIEPSLVGDEVEEGESVEIDMSSFFVKVEGE